MNGLKVVDSAGKEYLFEILTVEQGKNYRAIGMTIENNQGEDVGTNLWRYQMHPFDNGMSSGRDVLARSYFDANADATNFEFITAPPKVNVLTLPGGDGCTKMIQFNGNIFMLSKRYIYKCDPNYNVTLYRDLGANVVGTDMAVFNNQLVVACGSSGKMQASDANGTWTVSNDTYADKLAVVNDRLFRAYNNSLYSCSIDPLDSAAYIFSNTIGDSTYKVTSIIEYGGIPWPIKENGAYQADVAEVFKNQTPQMAQWPNARNGVNSFVAKGMLFVPTINGLLSITRGISKFVGPELANRGTSNMNTYAGAEWQGVIYLVCLDSSAYGPFIVKMYQSLSDVRDWIYHLYCQLGVPSMVPASMFISALPTNPTIFVGATSGDKVYYIKLGRGGGRDIDDDNYQYQPTWYLRTGKFKPMEDLSVTSIFHGVDIVTSLGRLDRMSVAVSADGGPFVELTTSAERAGEKIIGSTRPMTMTRLYAPPGLSGKQFDILMYGESDPNNAGVIRPEIYELWAFGYARPRHHDAVEFSIKASSNASVSGKTTGMTYSSVIQLWRNWIDAAEVLTIDSPFLEWVPSGKYIPIDMKLIQLKEDYSPHRPLQTARLDLRLVRLEYG